MANRTLSIEIHVRVHQPGPDTRLAHRHEVVVPSAYQEHDMEPFIRHQLDRAVADFQEEDFGGARAAAFLAAYDLRMQAIRHLLRRAPRDREVRALATLIEGVADLSNDELFERWGHLREHVED